MASEDDCKNQTSSAYQDRYEVQGSTQGSSAQTEAEQCLGVFHAGCKPLVGQGGLQSILQKLFLFKNTKTCSQKEKTNT